MPESVPPSSRVEITVSWTAVLKIVIALLLIGIVWRLSPLFIPLSLALLIAITLHPLLAWTQRRRWPHWAGLLLCSAVIVGSIALLVGVLVPTVATQGALLIEKLPEVKNGLLEHLPEKGGWRESANQILSSSNFSDPQPLLNNFLGWLSTAVEGVGKLFIVVVLAIYLLADGRRTYEWVAAFFPPVHRQKMAIAAPEFVSVAGHYVVGQLIVSTLAGIFVFTVLRFLHVPSAALLAVLAAILDVLPLLGIAVSTVLATGVALTVSPATALWAGLLYFGYHLLEVYVILPKVYGDRLRLSALAVLLACLSAVLLLGFVGAILVLPLVASYPIVEKTWLQPYLVRDTLQKHEELEEKEEE